MVSAHRIAGHLTLALRRADVCCLSVAHLASAPPGRCAQRSPGALPHCYRWALSRRWLVSLTRTAPSCLPTRDTPQAAASLAQRRPDAPLEYFRVSLLRV